jgi:hypothetical protein
MGERQVSLENTCVTGWVAQRIANQGARGDGHACITFLVVTAESALTTNNQQVAAPPCIHIREVDVI